MLSRCQTGRKRLSDRIVLAFLLVIVHPIRSRSDLILPFEMLPQCISAQINPTRPFDEAATRANADSRELLEVVEWSEDPALLDQEFEVNSTRDAVGVGEMDRSLAVRIG